MNQTHSQSDGFPPDGNEGDGVRAQDIEQRLRTYRPRPPQLDLAALEQAAGDIDPPVARAPQRSTGAKAWATMIAGSWVCGAVAGALVMFVILDHRGSQRAEATSTTEVTPATPRLEAPQAETRNQENLKRDGVLVQDDGEREEADEWYGSTPFMFTALFDPHSSLGGRDDLTLRASAHLRSFSTLQLSKGTTLIDFQTGRSGVNSHIGGSSRVQPALTRDHLLKELSDGDLGFLL